jgi:hypothetical protein
MGAADAPPARRARVRAQLILRDGFIVGSSQGFAASVKYSASAARTVPNLSMHQKTPKKQKDVENSIFGPPSASGDL